MKAVVPTSRRDFLKQSALAGGALVIAFVVPSANRFAQAQEAGTAAAMPFAPNAFLRIAADDSVTVLLAHSEMGQGIWTSLPMLIAEELDADWSKLRVEHAIAAPAYAHAMFGMQMTGGSSTISSEFDRYRQAGAMARALLVQAAAARMGVAVADCRSENGKIIAGEQSLRYGELVDDASKLKAPASVALKEPKDWKLIGKGSRRLDSPEKITGRAGFGIDVRFEGLLTAVVLRAPIFGGSVKSVDSSAAKQVPGVQKIVQVPSGVAVVADHYWAAKLGRDALVVEWEPGPNAALDSDALRLQFRAMAASDGLMVANVGDAASALTASEAVLEAEYFVPYLAHAPMEPLNCTVKIEPESCEIWTGTQFQTMDQMVAAQITGLRPEQVRVNTTFLGGGFGRRATPVSDFLTEAVHVAKAAGAPVKTVWSREDDIRGGYYRPMYLHRARIALDGEGIPASWDHTIVGQSILAGTPFESMMVKDGIDSTSTEGIADSAYLKAVANHRVQLHSPNTGIPVLWWRSVGHTHTAFVMETLVDELAARAGQDPLAYRRLLLKDHPRHLGVLNLAAEKIGWDTSKPLVGRARGIAVHESFGSFVAEIAEVSIEQGKIRVHRVVAAIDCGIAVNPDGVVAQLESAIAFGLGAALYSSLSFKDGRVQESNFHDYRVLRLSEMPLIEAHIVPSTLPPSGVGEPGTPPIAPAVANAIAALTGQRLRELPLRPTA